MAGIIINWKKYVLSNQDLLCEAVISRKGALFDFNTQTKRLYYAKGKTFILQTTYDLAGGDEYRVLSQKEAHAFMNKYPSGIHETVYKRYFGEPEEM